MSLQQGSLVMVNNRRKCTRALSVLGPNAAEIEARQTVTGGVISWFLPLIGGSVVCWVSQDDQIAAFFGSELAPYSPYPREC